MKHKGTKISSGYCHIHDIVLCAYSSVLTLWQLALGCHWYQLWWGRGRIEESVVSARAWREGERERERERDERELICIIIHVGMYVNDYRQHLKQNTNLQWRSFLLNYTPHGLLAQRV